MLIKGMAITLYEKGEAHRDGFNTPVYGYSDPVTVENVLVGQPEPQQIIDELSLSGKQIAYTLGIPKGDTHDWEDAIVEFFGHKFKTFGIPAIGIEANVPGPWHKIVKCERYA